MTWSPVNNKSEIGSKPRTWNKSFARNKNQNKYCGLREAYEPHDTSERGLFLQQTMFIMSLLGFSISRTLSFFRYKIQWTQIDTRCVIVLQVVSFSFRSFQDYKISRGKIFTYMPNCHINDGIEKTAWTKTETKQRFIYIKSD